MGNRSNTRQTLEQTDAEADEADHEADQQKRLLRYGFGNSADPADRGFENITDGSENVGESDFSHSFTFFLITQKTVLNYKRV